MDEIAYGQVAMSCQVREELTQQQGLIHGGVLSTIADVSRGYAALTTMDETSEVLTVEFKMNILRASSSSQIFAHAQVIKAGRTLVVVESTITDREHTVLAKMLSTMFRSELRS